MPPHLQSRALLLFSVYSLNLFAFLCLELEMQFVEINVGIFFIFWAADVKCSNANSLKDELVVKDES